MTLASAVGGLRAIPQWFVWRLVWSAEDGKFLKTPATPEGPWIVDASIARNWLSYEDAVLRAYTMQQGDTANRYALGFWLTAECGYWFLDLDKCIVEGQYTPIANELVGQLPGCFFEFSSSGNGCHVIGRGAVPEHSMRNKAHGLELYTEQRGIAFGLSGDAWGSADAAGPAITDIAAKYFPPRVSGADGDWLKPRPDWSGPADDEQLLARMMASTSTAARLGNRASFAQLWSASSELEKFYGPDTASERDAALAAHLAFWTGCDAPRIERLMRRSALVRPKWDEHRTYLRELTIEGACARQKDVLKEGGGAAAALYTFKPTGALPALPVLPGVDATALGGLTAPTMMVSAEAKATIDALLDMVHGSTTWEDVHNRVIPSVRAAGVPSALMSRLENAINKRLDLWDAKLPVNKLRALLKPVGSDGVVENTNTAPEWVKNYVYVEIGDRFHDLRQGTPVTRTGFNARHNRSMPFKGDSTVREDAAQWALDHWGVELVHGTIYFPGLGDIVAYNRLQWANEYVENSHPPLGAFTPEGIAAIERFQRHMFLLCGQRENVYMTLLSFLAHNVQHPGKKIRWCPIIKGTQGDGKSIIGNVLDAAMGGRNVSMIGPDVVCNSGGFTDWAHGRAVVVFEELYMTGRDRHRVANTVKPYITNNKVSINGKNDKPKDVPNTCNQLALSNHADAVPIEKGQDRRWLVIFTPYATREEMWAAIGVSNEFEAEHHFDVIFDSLAREPGQWRKWLMDWKMPEWFSPNRAALHTAEKDEMSASGIDDVESIARSIIDEGAYGVGAAVLSSPCLSRAMTTRCFTEGVDIPKTHQMHHLLNRLGYVQVASQLKWKGTNNRVWAKSGVDKRLESLRAALDATIPGSSR